MVFRIGVLASFILLASCGGDNHQRDNTASPSPTSVASPTTQPTASPEATPSSEPAPSMGPTPEPTPTAEAITLTDLEGDSLTEFVTGSPRLNDTLGNPNQSRVFESVLTFSFTLPEPGELGTYDVNTASDRRIRVYLQHDEDFSIYRQEFVRSPPIFVTSIGPKNYGKVEDSHDELSGFMEWEFEEGVLTLYVHPNTQYDEYATDQRVQFENPLEWQIRAIESEDGSAVLLDLTLPEDQEVRYIADIVQPNHTLVDIVPPAELELNTLFQLDFTDSDFFYKSCFLFQPNTPTAGISDMIYRYVSSESDPLNYDMHHRHQDLRSGINAPLGDYEFYEGTLIIKGQGSGADYVYVAYAYNEEDKIYHYARYRTPIEEGQKSQVVEDVKNQFRDYVFQGSARYDSQLLTFSETTWLSILNDGIYIPDSGQGENHDVDGDGVPNIDDGDPLDPEETLDTDLDGIGDNGDACPNETGTPFRDGCPPGT